MAWIHSSFINEAHDPSHDAEVWSDVDNFDDEYQQTNYWWQSNAVNDFIPQWNNACAIWLLIDRCNYLEGLVEAGGVGMDDILSAMVTANPDQVRYFVGLVDAYRQSIWNKPFNEEFFAAIARGFEQWE